TAAGQNERMTDRASSPPQARPSDAAIMEAGGGRDPMAPRDSPAVTAPTPREAIRNPKPSEPSPRTLRARRGTYTLKLNTQKLTMTWRVSMNRMDGVRAA